MRFEIVIITPEATRQQGRKEMREHKLITETAVF
jgi:hypothetical protein